MPRPRGRIHIPGLTFMTRSRDRKVSRSAPSLRVLYGRPLNLRRIFRSTLLKYEAPLHLGSTAQMIDFAIRRLRSCDSLDTLTHLLHRAFEDLAHRGIECQCAKQSTALTSDRVKRGECFIAVSGGQMIGTITLEHPDRSSAIEAYRDLATASIHQLAVDPASQGAGVGGALIAYAGAWAGARRYERLALDTPQGASREVAWYLGRGFDLAQTVHVPGRRYASTVLTKELPDFAVRRSGQAWMESGVPRPGKVQWVSANDSSVDLRRPYRVAT